MEIFEYVIFGDLFVAKADYERLRAALEDVKDLVLADAPETMILNICNRALALSRPPVE